MKKIPPNTYFSIARAADLLEIEIDDLLHMGSTGAIHLGVILDDLPSVLVQHVDKHGNVIYHESYAPECLVNSEFYYFDPHLYEGQQKEIRGGLQSAGLASGLWHINRGTVGQILQYGSGAIGLCLTTSFDNVDIDDFNYVEMLLLASAQEFDLPEDLFPDQEAAKNEIMRQSELLLKADDLYISRAWLLHIRECMENCTVITPKLGTSQTALRKIAITAQEHGNAKRFSQNRENCLMALIYTKRIYPEECKNVSGIETNDAWAAATLDHWHSVGAGYSQPSADFLKKIISDMDRIPSDRTTAGKPKVVDTKK